MRAISGFMLVGTVGALFAAHPASSAVFSVQTIACAVDNEFNSSTPVVSSGLCDPYFGSSTARAFATFGSVGASSTANTTGVNSSLIGGEGFASYRDVIRLTKSDPNAPDLVPVAVNLDFSGLFLATSGITSGAEARYGLSLATPGGTFNGNGIFNTSFGLVVTPSGLGESVAGAGFVDSRLISPVFMVNFAGQPFADFEIGFSLSSAAAAFGLAQAQSDFGHTLQFATGTDVFTLPAGYTANAGNYLLNNRFIDPNASGAIPEPATWAMLIAGLGLVGFALRRRRKAIGSHVAAYHNPVG